MPPVTARKKPKGYQFLEGAPHQENDKENQAPPRVERRSLSIVKPTMVPTATETNNSKLAQTPQTGTRLPLTHLVGSNIPVETSPSQGNILEEELLWRHSTPKYPEILATPARNNDGKNVNKRKRPMSSSPPSVDLNSRKFKTPKQDPAEDVWSRYCGERSNQAPNSGSDGLDQASQSKLENLLIDSSPRSSATAGSVRGLRRYASCGVQFPTSGEKEKRLLPAKLDRLRSLAGQSGSEVAAASMPKMSKVGQILEEASRLEMEQRLRAVGRSEEHSDSRESALRPPPRPNFQMESPLQTKSHIAGDHMTMDGPMEPKSDSHSTDFGEVEIDASQLDDLFQAVDNTETVSIKVNSASGENELALGDEFEDISFTEGELQHIDASLAAMTQSANPLATQELEQSQPYHVEIQLVEERFGNMPNQKIDEVMNIVSSPNEYEEEDDDFDLNDALALESQVNQDNEETERSLTIQRYLITATEEELFQDEKGRNAPQKVLFLEEEKSIGSTSSTEQFKQVFLRQSWFDTPCTAGSYVHVFGRFNHKDICIVDNAENMIILHPDHLVSATVVADAFGCMRRAVLQDRVKATGSSSPAMLYGTLLHELFQEAMKLNCWDMKTLRNILGQILPRHYETILDVGLNINQVNEHLIPKLLEMGAWASKFVRAEPEVDTLVQSRHGETVRLSINKLLDVEEHVWSPNYGLKGNIDATVQMIMEQNGVTKTLTVPFEVKTGKRESESHQAQTALYTLLVSDRYDIDVLDGVLYYLETSKTIHIPAVRNELIHMIMKRNELASYIRERRQLPPMLQGSSQRLCNNCYAQTACYLYHKLAEDGDGSIIEKKSTFQQLVIRLKPLHQEFFQKWDSLITKEESEVMRFRRELWTMLSKDREKVHRCFSEVVIAPGSTFEQETTSKINRFQYIFVKETPSPGFSFAESQIIVGDPIVVSDERGHFALAKGYVTSIHRKQIAIAVDRRLHNSRIKKFGFNARENQSFSGIMEVEPHSSAIPTDNVQVVYRIDKDEFSNGMATVRTNILQIMDDHVFKASDLRNLIIEGREPQFVPSSSAWPLPSQGWATEMNSDQKAAIEKIMSAKDYALVLGMPGTGKTTTIAQIIRSLVAKGKTVLLTSYTHTAVDNILLKVRGAGFDVLRLGVLAKIHPEVQEFAILGSEPKKSLEDLKESWQNPPVVATTCLGINHPVFSQRTFDYCIVDEASQITLPVCLGPIRMAQRFVLVGDHYQLPPLVQNKEAQEGGLDVSLFKLLSEQHPDAVVSLEHQYRMCSEVMTIANTLVYSGRLKCGNEAVATRRTSLPNPDVAMNILHSHMYGVSSPNQQLKTCLEDTATCLISKILDPERPVLFLNTDTVGNAAVDIANGSRITNPFEARLTVLIASALLSAGLPARDLGIVTFWRSQASLLRNLISHHGNNLSSSGSIGSSLHNMMTDVELHTADKFQGRDKEVILVSFVRSNTEGNVGDLLRDWRRINVAVTRARSKLILVGSARTLQSAREGHGAECLSGLVNVCKENEWMVGVDEDILDKHGIGDLVPMTQADPVHKRSPLRPKNSNFISPRRGKVPGKLISAGRPVIMDVLNDILGDEKEN